MKPEQMTAHVVEICARSRIRIRWIKGYRARALGEFFEIEIPPIRSAITYGTALHEIGHCLGRYQTSRSVIVVERWAWEWARRNALVWTPAMERSAAKSLAWYEARRWPPRIVNGLPGCQCD